MISPIEAMRNLLADDKRYKLEAYQFIREALQYAQDNLHRLPAPDEPQPMSEEEGGQHLTGQQLSEACRLYAIEQYGFMAPMVLRRWGLTSTGDFGELVYNLIGIEQMRKSPADRREDFDNVYDFADAFEPEFELITNDED